MNGPGRRDEVKPSTGIGGGRLKEMPGEGTKTFLIEPIDQGPFWTPRPANMPRTYHARFEALSLIPSALLGHVDRVNRQENSKEVHAVRYAPKFVSFSIFCVHFLGADEDGDVDPQTRSRCHLYLAQVTLS